MGIRWPLSCSFLSEYIKRNGKGIDTIKSARKWFENLNIIFPNTHRTDFPFRVVNDTQFRTVMRELLNYFGTGISDLRRVESKPEELGIPDEIRQHLRVFKEPPTITLQSYYFFSKWEHKIIVSRVI